MKILERLFRILRNPTALILIALEMAPLAHATGDTTKADADGFQPLFNGKNLDGWAGARDSVRVQDGVLQWKPKKSGVLYTQEQYANFIMRFEFKLTPGANNGLAIRYPGKGDAAYTGMCELQILDDNYEKISRHSIDPRQAHGSAYGMAAARRGFQRPTGEWNQQQVTIIGSTIKVELNGTTILDTDLAAITRTLGNKAHPGKNLKTGHLGFTGHNDPVAFRNIYIKKLPEPNTNAQ